MKPDRPPGRLLVVQPSLDYAGRVAAAVPEPLFAALPERAAQLRVAGHDAVAVPLAETDLAAHLLAAHCTASSTRLGGIVTFVCEHLAATAGLAHHLQLPFHSGELVRQTRHKDQTAAVWRAAGVPVPAGQLVHTVAELRAFAATVPGPWILKPVDGSGSEWVLKVEATELLAAAHEQLREGLRGGHQDGAYLVQSFVRGREISADVYVDGDDVSVPRLTEKHLLDEPDQAGLVGAYYPARVDGGTSDHLVEVYRRAAAALGIDRGLVMVDGILAEGRLHLLELGLRPGGDCLPDLCRAATGYDPVRAACQAALGQRPELPDWRGAAPVAALHLMVDRQGTIRRIDTSRLEADPRVLHVEVYHEAGEQLRLWTGSYDDRILAAAVVRCPEASHLPVLERELAGLIDLELEEDHVAQRRGA